jgi:hypothetical protein
MKGDLPLEILANSAQYRMQLEEVRSFPVFPCYCQTFFKDCVAFIQHYETQNTQGTQTRRR